MKITLQRAFTESCMSERECFICEKVFNPAPVSVVGGPHGEEICYICFAFLDERRANRPMGIEWPTFKEFLEFWELYKEPIFRSSEECAEAERLGLFDDFLEASCLA